MRSAPPVVVTCEGGLAWAGLLVVPPALAGAAVAAWLSAWAELPSAGAVIAGLAAAALAGPLGWFCSNEPAAPLTWDGACWSAGSPAVVGQVDVMIDLGRWILLRFRPEPAGARVRWLPVSAAGVAMHGLRVALHGGPARAVHVAAGPRGAERQPG